ncbi:hypothetical protein MA16_Dca010441 [Dendrobium catenatum]|uniref:Uncharacterized protein n=1 Tax=Dendrobium catenatum TaxID=906689 RepID=A0A2I0XBJ7_9ASPA|nr:hypothetical protein MA16_Dca010441 [Dendrobium catenatum]
MTTFNFGVKVNSKMNKPLFINEGGLLLKKKETYVVGKGKKILVEDNLEALVSSGMALSAKGDLATCHSSNSKTELNNIFNTLDICSISCWKEGSPLKGANGSNESNVLECLRFRPLLVIYILIWRKCGNAYLVILQGAMKFMMNCLLALN